MNWPIFRPASFKLSVCIEERPCFFKAGFLQGLNQTQLLLIEDLFLDTNLLSSAGLYDIKRFINWFIFDDYPV